MDFSISLCIFSYEIQTEAKITATKMRIELAAYFSTFLIIGS